jgi:hypothetical protein
MHLEMHMSWPDAGGVWKAEGECSLPNLSLNDGVPAWKYQYAFLVLIAALVLLIPQMMKMPK